MTVNSKEEKKQLRLLSQEFGLSVRSMKEGQAKEIKYKKLAKSGWKYFKKDRIQRHPCTGYTIFGKFFRSRTAQRQYIISIKKKWIFEKAENFRPDVWQNKGQLLTYAVGVGGGGEVVGKG